MATIFFSGVDRPSHLALLCREQASGMINATHATQRALLTAYRQWPHIPLALDSLRQRDIGAYIATIEEIEQFFCWISNLDVIGDQRTSNKNYEYLQSHLPPAMRQKILWIFQPGGSLCELEDMASRRRIVGIGGLVPLLKRQGHEAALRYLTQVGERLMQVGAQAHIFGLASPTIIFRLRAAPWLASIDSSKWLVAYRASQVLRLTGTGQCRATQLHLCLKLDEMAANNIRVMKVWILPAHPQQLLLPLNEDGEQSSLPEASVTKRQPLYQFFVFLQDDIHLDIYVDAFWAAFAHWIGEVSGGSEENELLITLLGPVSLGDELDEWYDQAPQAGLMDYGWQCAEEDLA